MHNKWIALLLWTAGLYLAARFLFLPLLPFLLALSLAVLQEPGVLWCCRRLGFQRKFAAAALTTVVLGGMALGLGLLLGQLWREGMSLLERLPEALEQVPRVVDGISGRYEVFYRACPARIRLWLDEVTGLLQQEGISLAGDLSGAALGWASGLMGQLPQITLFLFTTVLATYFTAVSYPEILRFLRRQVPRPWQEKWRGVACCLRSTFWKWMKAESILCLVTFLMLLLGFWYLHLDYVLLPAVLIALIDALPVLGIGVIMVPWSVYHLLLGSVPRGIALLALYAIIMLVRSLLEPRVMAAQAGLPPLTALAAMYLGFSLLGVGGMFLLPVALLFVKQLRDGGFVRIWK